MKFTDEIIERIWQKAQIVVGYDPNVWRKDFAGAWIRHDFYGITNEYGWEIDHKKPLANGGTDHIDNLWALHWKNNREKGDSYPNFKTCVSSVSNKNIQKEVYWTW